MTTKKKLGIAVTFLYAAAFIGVMIHAIGLKETATVLGTIITILGGIILCVYLLKD